MKAHISLNRKQREDIQNQLDYDIKTQIAKSNDEFANDFDTVVLYVLNQCYGFGKKRLKKFHDLFIEEYNNLVEYYDMKGEGVFVARQKLERMGVDIDKWNEERSHVKNDLENK